MKWASRRLGCRISKALLEQRTIPPLPTRARLSRLHVKREPPQRRNRRSIQTTHPKTYRKGEDSRQISGGRYRRDGMVGIRSCGKCTLDEEKWKAYLPQSSQRPLRFFLSELCVLCGYLVVYVFGSQRNNLAASSVAAMPYTARSSI